MGKDLKGKELEILFDYMHMVEQAAIETDPVLGPYVLTAVTEGLTFVELKSMYDIPCERGMFYDRRRKFFWVLSGVRKIYNGYNGKKTIIHLRRIYYV